MKKSMVLAALGLASVLSARAGVDLWQVFPALPEQPTADMRFRAMMPKGQALVQMADNEYETLVVGVENRSDKYLTYTVDASAIAKAVPGVTVEVRSSWEVPISHFPQNGKAEKAMGATSYGKVGQTGDPLLPCPADRQLGCPAYENRSFWVTLHANGAKAGTYRANVTVTSDQGVSTLPVTIEVWPFRLADKLKAICYHWDYSTSPEAIKDEVEHCVNTFMMPFDMNRSLTLKDGKFTADFGKSATHQYMKAKLAVAPDAYFIGSYGFFGEFCDWAQKNKVKYMSEEFKTYFKQAIQALVAELKSLGLGYARYWLQHWVEANGGSAKKVVEMGPIAKEADPNVQWFFDHMSNWGEITSLAPYSQMMGPRGEATWTEGQKKWYDGEFRSMHKDAKLLQFKQKGIYRGDKDVNHYNRYRPWRTWLNHWDGFCTFAHAYCVYFWGSDHPTSVRQWEVSREGYEDYKYFELYLDLAEKAGRRDEAVKFLDKLVQDILGPTGPGTMQLYGQESACGQWYPYWGRQQVAKKIAELAGKPLQEVGEYAPQAYAYQLPKDGVKEVALADRNCEIEGEKFEPEVVGLQVRMLNNQGETYPLQFAVDDYYLNLPNVLTAGEEYELRGEYCCPADKVPQPKLQIFGIVSENMYCTERDGKFHPFSVKFTVPEGASDLNISFKEIRNMVGERIENRCDLKGLMLVRRSPGGKALPKAGPAPKVPPKSFAKGLKGEYQVRGAKVVKGRMYAIAVDYSSDHNVSYGLEVKAALKHGPYPHVYALSMLRDTKGRDDTEWSLFQAIMDEDIIVIVGRNEVIQYEDEQGVRHPAKLAVKGIRLYEIPDSDGVARKQAQYAKTCTFLPKVCKLFGNPKGNVTTAQKVDGGKRFVTLYNTRPERSLGFLMPDKEQKPYGWRVVVIPAMSEKVVEVPAEGKTTEFWSLNRDAPDLSLSWE